MSGYSAQGQISIKRARKGESGLDGVSYQIRTSVESVRCAPDGTPHIASFTASLWRSQGDSNAVNVSATIKCNDNTIGTGTSVTINTSSGTTLYTLIAFVDNEIKATKAIGIIKDGSNGVTPTRYFLLGSVSQLNTDAGRTLNPSCTVTAYKQTGNEAPVALTSATTHSIAVRGYNAIAQNVYAADGTVSMTFNANSRSTTSYGYPIRFEITLTVGSNIDKLTIPVTLDGAKGDKGDTGNTGAQGYNGCVPRFFDVGLVAGQRYYCNDTVVNSVDPNEIDNTDGIRHIDAVAVLDATMESGFSVYQCKRNYTATQNAQTKAEFESIANWSTYFIKVSANAASAYFTYIMAQNAFIKMLAGAMMVVQDENANVIGGMQGNSALPIFWAGAQLPANGLWQQMANGFASYGTPNGERIELDPVNKTISFYNSSGQLVTEHNAKTYSSVASLLPSTGTFTVETGNKYMYPSTTICYNVEDVVTLNLSNVVSVSANGVLKVNFTKLYCTISTPTPSGGGQSKLMSTPTVNIRLELIKYSNSEGTTKVGRNVMRSYTAYGAYDDKTYSSGWNQSTVQDTATATVQSGFYYRLVAILTSTGGNNSIQSTCRGYVNLASASIVADYYSSRFFGNGLMLSKNTANYFAAMLEGSVFRFIATNAYYGLDISSSGMLARRGDYWHKQPITLIALRIVQSSDSSMSVKSYNGVTFIQNSSRPTTTSGAVYLVSNGKFRIYFPTNWQAYTLSTNGFPQCSSSHYYDSEEGYLCYVQTLNNSYLEVWAADDWSANRGSLYVELKMF